MRYEEAKKIARAREELNQLQDLPTAGIARGAMGGAMDAGLSHPPTAKLLRDAADGLERRAKNLRALADELPQDADSEELLSDAIGAIHRLWRL